MIIVRARVRLQEVNVKSSEVMEICKCVSAY